MATKVERAIKGKISLPNAHGTTLTKKVFRELPSVSGFDIEADSGTADPFLITWSNPNRSGHVVIQNAKQILEFLTRHSAKENINFFFNIQYDFEGLLKLFPPEVSLQIYGNNKVRIGDNLLPTEKGWIYEILYIPKKSFTIRKNGGKNKFVYFDLWQYYSMGLNAAAEKYLGENKDDFDASTSSIKRFQEEPEYRREIIHYGIKDSILCRRLGELIVEGISEFVSTRNYSSTATISEYFFRSNDIGIPQFPNSVYKKFMKSYYGGRFEITKRGYIENVNMYDIKSAYPFAMRDMPIITNSAIAKNVYSPNRDALFGSYSIDVNIPDNYISPLPERSGIVKFPVGKFKDYWTDKETLGLLDSLDIKYKVNRGMEIYDKNSVNSLGPLIDRLFSIKEDKTNSLPVRQATKIIMNSLYGKFIQLQDDTILKAVETLEELEKISMADIFELDNQFWKREHTNNFKAGKLFAPFYASYITAKARSQLYQAADKAGIESLVGFHTDSIMLIDKTIPCGNKLGDWEPESLNANVTLVKSGFYKCEIGDKVKLRARGIGKTDNIIKPDFQVSRRYGLNRAVKKNFEKMNVISNDVIIRNNLDTDEKRLWNQPLTAETFEKRMLIESRPLTI